jgi:hypothetical protein
VAIALITNLPEQQISNSLLDFKIAKSFPRIMSENNMHPPAPATPNYRFSIHPTSTPSTIRITPTLILRPPPTPTHNFHPPTTTSPTKLDHTIIQPAPTTTAPHPTPSHTPLYTYTLNYLRASNILAHLTLRTTIANWVLHLVFPTLPTAPPQPFSSLATALTALEAKQPGFSNFERQKAAEIALFLRSGMGGDMMDREDMWEEDRREEMKGEMVAVRIFATKNSKGRLRAGEVWWVGREVVKGTEVEVVQEEEKEVD